MAWICQGCLKDAQNFPKISEMFGLEIAKSFSKVARREKVARKMKSCPKDAKHLWNSPRSATLMGSGRWSVFKFPFIDPEGILYVVKQGKFHNRSPYTHA